MERWATVKQIDQAALDRDMSERTVFLDEICGGDEALRSEIQSLLSYQDEAESFIEVPANKTLDRDPKNLFARELRGAAYFKTGDIEGMLADDLTRAELLGMPEATLAAMKHVHAEFKEAYEAGGYQEATRCILKHAPREAGPGRAGLVLAVLHAEAGDLDAAFEHLDQAIDARDPGLVHLAVAPQWDRLREDPRFNQRLARMRLQPVSCT